jgi:hypothetical protein
VSAAPIALLALGLVLAFDFLQLFFGALDGGRNQNREE